MCKEYYLDSNVPVLLDNSSEFPVVPNPYILRNQIHVSGAGFNKGGEIDERKESNQSNETSMGRMDVILKFFFSYYKNKFIISF